MLVRVLDRLPFWRIWIVVVEDAEVRSGFGPDVIRLGRMHVRVVAVRGGKRVVVGSSVGDLLADIDLLAADSGGGGAVDKAVDEGGGGILIDLMKARRRTVIGLRPIVILERDHEDGLHLLRRGRRSACGNQRGGHSNCANSFGV